MRALRAVLVFEIHYNLFTGTLPDGGVGAMGAATDFSIKGNGFTGALPTGIRAMSEVLKHSAHNGLKALMI
eukprot:3782530-Amphidinium_carterae.1